MKENSHSFQSLCFSFLERQTTGISLSFILSFSLFFSYESTHTYMRCRIFEEISGESCVKDLHTSVCFGDWTHVPRTCVLCKSGWYVREGGGGSLCTNKFELGTVIRPSFYVCFPAPRLVHDHPRNT